MNVVEKNLMKKTDCINYIPPTGKDCELCRIRKDWCVPCETCEQYESFASWIERKHTISKQKGAQMYDELISNLRNLHRAYVATNNAKPGQLFADAADAIEHLQKTVLRLENELGIYDELPLVDQKEKI